MFSPPPSSIILLSSLSFLVDQPCYCVDFEPISIISTDKVLKLLQFELSVMLLLSDSHSSMVYGLMSLP